MIDAFLAYLIEKNPIAGFSFAFTIVYVASLLYRSLRSPCSVKINRMSPIVIKNYTPTELAQYDGSHNPRIFMAVKGKILDVTSGAQFYGPGAPYGTFAGRDASRGLAKHSFSPDMLTALDQPIDTLNDLMPDEIEALNDWERRLTSKYTLVGYLVNPSDQKS